MPRAAAIFCSATSIVMNTAHTSMNLHHGLRLHMKMLIKLSKGQGTQLDSNVYNPFRAG